MSDDPDRMVRRYCQILRTTDPSPAVLRALDEIEAGLDPSRHEAEQ